ncbi:oxidoreductase [Rhodococcus erythropolis]|uniref:Oxidoreductase n=1 Tax=Rhodococcus erythropolis TaxID=1833 RepID=A0A5N5DVR9_RHOER|nr:oxidoreductase [Rhodococcus erythropolis]
MTENVPLVFGVLDEFSVGGGGAATLWTHPRDQRLDANSLRYWVDLAATAEQANLDLLFLGDVLGLYDTYGGNHHAAVKWAIEAPANDPAILVAALASATEHLAFTVTSSTTYEDPFNLARRFSTLDHLSDGRFGWNVVTSYLRSAAHNFGLTQVVDHSERYARAEEFLDVVYKLWEGSWADDAVIADKKSQTYAQGDRVRPINHVGDRFSVAGPHVSAPSAQRTPVIFQAGNSQRGRQFGGRHAEIIFTGDTDPRALNSNLTTVREIAVAEGRSPEHVNVMAGFSVIVGKTEIDAQKKLDELQDSYHIDGVLANYAGTIGVDLSRLADSEPIPAGDGADSWVLRSDGSGEPATVAYLRDRLGKVATRRDAVFIGTPSKVASQIADHASISGARAYMLLQQIGRESLDDFANLVAPELVSRGLLRNDPPTGTLRSRLTPTVGDRLPAESYAARYRFPHPL